MSETKRYRTERVGTSAQPVVIIDDFHPNFDRLRRAAAELDFVKTGPHYPGVQAPADPRHLQAVAPMLTDVFQKNIQPFTRRQPCSMQLFGGDDSGRRSRADPAAASCRYNRPGPHCAAPLPFSEESGGTAFYRHRATGAEILDDRNFTEYRAAVEAEGLPKPGYMRGSDDRFEMIGHIRARPNRAVMYRSQLLHSGMIPKDLPFSKEPDSGRLTLNSFFQAKP